jgi:20S proteasome alpha/beta subunit
MTLIVGIKCKDGIVLGADGAATYGTLGQSTIRQPHKKKLKILGNHGIVGVSGPVGIGQRFAGELEAMLSSGLTITTLQGQQKQTNFGALKQHEAMSVLRDVLWKIIGKEMEIARVMTQTINNPAPVQNTLSQSIVCMTIDGKPSMIHFDPHGSPEAVDDELPFVALGSGQMIADPFLAFIRRVFWNDQAPATVKDGVFGAVWAIQHTIQTNPGGVGPPIQIITYSKVRERNADVWKIQELPEADNLERLQDIKTLEKEIAALQAKTGGAGVTSPVP